MTSDEQVIGQKLAEKPREVLGNRGSDDLLSAEMIEENITQQIDEEKSTNNEGSAIEIKLKDAHEKEPNIVANIHEINEDQPETFIKKPLQYTVKVKNS